MNMRLIDADKAISDYAHYGINHPYDAYDLEDILNECPEIEAITKDQYEARLKADTITILDKIRTEIENHCTLIKSDHCRYCYYCNNVMGVREILELIDKYKTDF